MSETAKSKKLLKYAQKRKRTEEKTTTVVEPQQRKQHKPKRSKPEDSSTEKKKKTDGRSKGRNNDYVITAVTDIDRQRIWSEVTSQKIIVDRSAEKIPMDHCWVYGKRKGYSYYPLAHGESQLKLTQLAVWIKDGKVRICMLWWLRLIVRVLLYRYHLRTQLLLIDVITNHVLIRHTCMSLTLKRTRDVMVVLHGLRSMETLLSSVRISQTIV